MKYNHDSMLPIGAFKPRGSVVGGRSMRLHGGDGMYMAPEEDERGVFVGGSGDSGGYWEAAPAPAPVYNEPAPAPAPVYNEPAPAPVYVDSPYIAPPASAAAPVLAPAPAATNWTQTINDIYQQEFGRQADPSGLASFTNLLNQGLTGEQMREALRTSAEGQSRGLSPAPQGIASLPAATPPAYTPYNLNQYGYNTDQETQYYNAAKLANWQMSQGRPDLAQQYIQQANELKKQLDSPYRIDTITTSGGGDSGGSVPETVLVDRSGNIVSSVTPQDGGKFAVVAPGTGDSGSSTTGGSFTLDDIIKQSQTTTAFGTGVGQAVGRPYELKNAEGEPYQRYDANGNLTEFVNRLTGEWTKASDVKPIGTVFDPTQGKFVTEYQYGDNKFISTPGSGGSTFAPIMDPYSKDTGGFLGEGGWAKMATLVAAGFAPFALPYLSAGLAAAGATGALGTAGAAGIYGGLTTVGKGLLSGKSFEDSVVDGLKSGAISAVTAGVLSGLSPDVASGLGEEFGDIINIGNSEEGIGSFLDAVKESGGKFTGDVSGAGSDMTFDDLVSSTGATQGKGGIEDYYDAAKEISRTNENDVYEALKKYFSAGYEGVPVPGSETAALTTVGATPEQINDLEAMGIKLPQVGGNYSKWHEFADDPSSMVIPPVTNQEIPLVDLTKDGVLSYNDLLDYLTETVGQYGTISKDGVVTGIPDHIKNNINNLLGTSAGIAGLAALIKGGQLAGLGGTGTGGGSSGAGEGSGDGVGDGGGTGGGGAGGIGGGGAGGGGGGGGTGNGAGESDTDLELKRQKLNQQVYPQVQNVLVKPPPVAEIDYMYDIGGESVFATPKQETLMPSPFEETPEAVEGAMPRYQYYDPQGGYQYAEGGSINDLYELLRSK